MENTANIQRLDLQLIHIENKKLLIEASENAAKNEKNKIVSGYIEKIIKLLKKDIE